MPVLSLFPTLGLTLGYLMMTAFCHPPVSACKLTQRMALCDAQQLVSVPGDLPENIEDLSLNNNHIKALENGCLSRYRQLRSLSCANNDLETVGSNVFRDLLHLESLNLAENMLRYGDGQTGQFLRFLSSLKVLDLSSNSITEDMASELLQNLTSLERLSLSRNLLSRLDDSIFSDLHQLKELNLERNQLYEIDGAFDNLNNLQRLNLAFNLLPCLVQFEMTQLLVLNASHNNIEWFITNQDLKETFRLETLDLSDNKLLFFPFLPASSHLRNLLLSQNKISFYHHLANMSRTNWTNSVVFYNLQGNVSNVTAELWDETLHGDISSLELLDLSGNLIANFPRGFLLQMPHLYQLKLRTNCMESLNVSSGELPATLHELDVSNNRVTTLHAGQRAVSDLNNLTHLNLSLNDIQRLPPKLFSSLPRLSTADLSYNTIGVCDQNEDTNASYTDCLVWGKIGSLRQLHLAGCNIVDLSPSAFEGSPLVHLELSNNVGLHLKPNSLAGLAGTLQHLGLGNTGLLNFDFSPFHHLRSLNISKNSISQLPESLMELDLKLLDLSGNNLTTIPSEQASRLAQTLESVFVNGNRFNCCHLNWYRTFEKLVNIVDLAEVRCFDQTHKTQNVVHFDSHKCGANNEESIWWYILLLSSMIVIFLSITGLIFLTLKPRVLPNAIKKKCWKATSY
ncbi:transforming growth factor beta activator LRRC33 [Alosa sapidissima]|uniref:transforming growth factor beta activator LRRC33 n=1 Tax=Alosa sapidissima TaxID=34773 RepID=UPI001C096361|nr:transforming growth factor beta activator LRRC33 [Alosa sapidissima]XP_041924391.1 transforming growth factor beta activator LRRC33 [Alosa sapidissima]XP_041924392.1 transforming growth factor beta activator LRRC33 [Alosa sapidissima]